MRKPLDSLGVQKSFSDESLKEKLLLIKRKCGLATAKTYQKEDEKMNKSSNDLHTLSHTTWNCKYHIVFAPKYRRKVFYREKKAAIGKILRQLCEWKGVRIIEAEACPNHIHLFVEIPLKISVSHFMGYLKGKTSLMIFDKHANLTI